jgi:hypothetical protein
MPKFRVTLTRTAVQTHDRDFEATDKADAEAQARDIADIIDEKDWSDYDEEVAPHVTEVVKLAEPATPRKRPSRARKKDPE